MNVDGYLKLKLARSINCKLKDYIPFKEATYHNLGTAVYKQLEWPKKFHNLTAAA